MANRNLSKAKANKNDEFYTQYADVQKEINAYLEFNPDVFRNKTILLPCDDPEWSNFTKFFAQHFEDFGLKKLISTSYAIESKHNLYGSQLSLFETDYEKTSKQYDAKKSQSRGKIFVLDKDTNADGCINYDDLQWNYLNGDGDFRSEEVKKLRDEADIIITNPPFSLFTPFLLWIMDADKKFLILGNMNAIAYKEIFPLIMNNKVWLGVKSGAKEYRKPDGGFQKMGNTYWFTNLEHGRRHQPMQLMTMEDNIKYSKHKEVKNVGYKKYENYDAIEIPKSDAIPSDYEGVMGVPISWLDRYCPEQFEIIGMANGGELGIECGVSSNLSDEDCKRLFKEDKGFRRGKLCYRNEAGKLISCFAKILIRKKI